LQEFEKSVYDASKVGSKILGKKHQTSWSIIMSVETTKLADMARIMKCDAINSAGRSILFEDTVTKDHLVVCNDVVIISSMKKRGTFSFRKPNIKIISLGDMTLDTSPGSVITISCKSSKDVIQLTCSDELHRKKIQGSLIGAVANVKKQIIHHTDSGKLLHSSSKELVTLSEEHLALESLKVAALFDRMLGLNDGNSLCIKVFREIFDTECSYVEDLRKLVNEYMEPLSDSTDTQGEPIISPEDIQTIFVNVASILKVNLELLHSLQDGILALGKDGNVPSICNIAGVFGGAFVHVIPFFKMYAVYCHHYSSSLARLCTLRETNPNVASVIMRREMRKKNVHSSLQSLLIKPVQRICKYPLLFRELLKNMDKLARSKVNDDEFMLHFTELTRTAKAVELISASVNNKVNEAESQEQVLKCYFELGGEHGFKDLLTPTRRFVRNVDVSFREAPYHDSKKLKARMFVFNDLVIIATGLTAVATLGRHLTLKKSNLKVAYALELGRCGVKTTGTDGDSFEIRVVTRVVTQQQHTTTNIQRFEISCDSRDMCESLVKDLNTSIEKLEVDQGDRDEHKPVQKTRAWANRKGGAVNWKSKGQAVVEEEPTTEVEHSDSIKEHFEKKFVAPELIVIPDDESHLRLKVEFPAGPLGMALENSFNPRGVLVACVAAMSVAEKGGLTLGDRVVYVDTHEVGDDETWEDVVKVIKRMSRPLTITFERQAGLKSDENNSTKSRQWAQRIHQRRSSSGTDKLVSLQDLESNYKDAESVIDLVGKSKLVLDRLPTGSDALRELVNTEHTYVCDLRRVLGDYLIPLRKSKLLDEEQESVLFGSLETILRINTTLLKGMQKAVIENGLAADDELFKNVLHAVTEAFTEVAPYMKVYTNYCYRYPTTISKFVAWRKENHQLDELLLKLEQQKTKTETMESLLIKPVQRICKYPLLIRSLMQSIADPSCLESLKKAAVVAEKLASDINQKVREAEDMDKVLEIHLKLGGKTTLVEPHRRHVYSGTVQTVHLSSDPKCMDLHLFNDRLILAAGKQIVTLELAKSDVKHLEGKSLQLTHVSRSTSANPNTSLSRVTTSIDKYKLSFDSENECNKVVLMVSDLIEGLTESSASLPVKTDGRRSWKNSGPKTLENIENKYTTNST